MHGILTGMSGNARDVVRDKCFYNKMKVLMGDNINIK